MDFLKEVNFRKKVFILFLIFFILIEIIQGFLFSIYDGIDFISFLLIFFSPIKIFFYTLSFLVIYLLLKKNIWGWILAIIEPLLILFLPKGKIPLLIDAIIMGYSSETISLTLNIFIQLILIIYILLNFILELLKFQNKGTDRIIGGFFILYGIFILSGILHFLVRGFYEFNFSFFINLVFTFMYLGIIIFWEIKDKNQKNF